MSRVAQRRKFLVQFSVEVEVEQALLDSVLTDEWRSQMYNFHTPEQVAGHLAFNFIQGTELTSIDGYADQDPKRASSGPIDIDIVQEIQSKPTRTLRTKQVANVRRSTIR